MSKKEKLQKIAVEAWKIFTEAGLTTEEKGAVVKALEVGVAMEAQPVISKYPN